MTILSITGLVFGAAVFLLMLQKVLLGALHPKWAGLADISRREIFTLVPLAIMILWVGLWPKAILLWQVPTLSQLLYRLGGNLGW